MAFYYDCMELSTALKPFFIRTLLREGHVVYLDPDIEVLGDLGEIFEAVRTNDVVLTPHLTEPLPADGRRPELIDFVRVGQFNLGFLGVGRSECSLRLSEWWGKTLVENCASDLRRDLFTDQVHEPAGELQDPLRGPSAPQRHNVGLLERHAARSPAGPGWHLG
jgi:hypothetical protein